MYIYIYRHTPILVAIDGFIPPTLRRWHVSGSRRARLQDLVAEAAAGRLDTVFGREKAIRWNQGGAQGR